MRQIETLQLTKKGAQEHDLETCTKHSPFAHAILEVLLAAGGAAVERSVVFVRAEQLLTDRGVPKADWLRKP